ncbi:methyl-accepting chemotaxis protein [Domibacillus sp. PGB-M46]|uniref:methyl-accepting chemotaxis protein n=1 Tax=Domibacillus sp. PGB-M46 TaxID=2910255 RepID=UPI001F586219|nr:methyl-accepting chemotaxis protein [Domibacillus sp. PGB-M46]MCI2256046.1 methyl-accepting chemotaxis protein [Domibacillus sp. PGB-M46]
MRPASLKTQFIVKAFIILLVISLVSGVFQIYLIQEQVQKSVNKEADLIAKSIEQGITSTNLAALNIEKQIDLKMESYAVHIADLIKNQTIDEITTEELISIRNELGLAGITLFARTEDKTDIIGTKSSDRNEIGFSLKEFSEDGYSNMDDMLKDKPPTNDGYYSYMTNNLFIIPISQSASNEEESVFFKYAYYHVKGTDYIINPYIEANEVYKFTNATGPDAWIKASRKDNPFVEEIAVLDNRVYKDPSLAEKIYPPLNKIVHGKFEYETKKDVETLINSTKSKKVVTYIQKNNGKKVYKTFLPVNENKVIYIALDYEEMSAPIYKHSIILILTGLISLLSLFLLIVKFFNRIYGNILKIMRQINLLEEGNLTAKSKVNDGSELDTLSKTTNRMVEKLNQLVTDTQEQAKKTQRLSMILEMETAQSLDKMYAVSTEATMKSREQLYEITEFLNDVLNALEPTKENSSVIENVERMKKVATDRTAAVTNATITLSDLMQSLHEQSSELSAISNILLKHISKFKL